MSKNFLDDVMGLIIYYFWVVARLTMINIFQRVMIRP
jgi:hypothetical protein